MKIYTKKGDKGMTSLLGGTQVPKYQIRIDAYGTVDELNSFIGLLRDQKMTASIKEVLFIIQNKLFTIGSLLASEPNKSKIRIPSLTEEDVTLLEQEIDSMNTVLPEMRSFILPGGHTTVSYCHIARSVCRRAERICVQLSKESSVSETVIMYLNRLSDYLFVLARKLAHDLHVEEIKWIP